MSEELNLNPGSMPSRVAQSCLRWSLPKALKEIVLGDLEEEFHQKCLRNGSISAQSWYLRQALLTSFTYLKQTQRGMLMFALSLLVFVAMIAMAFLFSGDVRMFVNIPSLLIVLPPALFFSMAATSRQALGNGVKMMFHDQIDVDKVQLLESKRAFTTMGGAAMLLGVLGFVIGFIAISTNIEPEAFKKVIGPALAVSFTTLLYGILIKIPCFVIEQKIQHKLESLEQ